MRALGVAISSLLLASSTGCQPTPDKIATWKGTQRGPGKLRDVVRNGGAKPELRALAATALVEIGMGQEAMRDVGSAAPATKAAIAAHMVAPLITVLGDSLSRPGPTTPAQRAAKDALFVLRGDAPISERARIDDALLKWTTVDLAARATAGGESTEKILAAIGPPAATAVAPLVRPGPDLLLAAKIVGELGEPETKARAVQPLLAIARGGAVNEAVLQALGLVGGAEATQVLLDLASRGPVDGRQKALYALAQGRLSAGDEKALAGALAIAGDAHADGGVREAAFQVLEKLGPGAVGGTLRLFSDANETVRYRAVEAALKAGGAEAVPRILAALPERPIKSEDLDSYVVHDLTLLPKEALPQLVAAANKPPALGQIAAIRALGRVGGAREADALAPLASDGGTTRLLTPPTTVGQEVGRAREAIGKRGGGAPPTRPR